MAIIRKAKLGDNQTQAAAEAQGELELSAEADRAAHDASESAGDDDQAASGPEDGRASPKPRGLRRAVARPD